MPLWYNLYNPLLSFIYQVYVKRKSKFGVFAIIVTSMNSNLKSTQGYESGWLREFCEAQRATRKISTYQRSTYHCDFF